jgi:histidinol-phosphate phosphatase family protein
VRTDDCRNRPGAEAQPARRAGVLLDRDGTIIVDRGYVGSVGRVELIPGAAEAIAALNNEGVPVAVVTNQAGVARGYYGLEDVTAVHERIAKLIADYRAHIDAFFFCPYHPAGVVNMFSRSSEDRKPRPGMAIAAARALNLDLTRSWVVGDRPEDVGLAGSIGAYGIYLGDRFPEQPGVWCLPDLASAVSFILERITNDCH